MESRPGGTNLVEPRGQGAALPSGGGPAVQPWWTSSGAVLGAVSPAVVAPGSGTGISLSSSPAGGSGGGGAAKGAPSDESSEDSRRSGEPKGMALLTLFSPLLVNKEMAELLLQEVVVVLHWCLFS
jgi:nuclear transcription factor Y alpha